MILDGRILVVNGVTNPFVMVAPYSVMVYVTDPAEKVALEHRPKEKLARP